MSLNAILKRAVMVSTLCVLTVCPKVCSASDVYHLPSAWYAGDEGKKPTVRNQGKYATCWAITAASALEAALLPSRRIIFSADHMTHRNAFTALIDDGGDYFMLMAYFCGWQGPVTEQEDPYGDEVSPEGLSPAIHVQEVHLLQNPDTEHVKEEVFSFGSVQTSLFMDRSTAENDKIYNADTASYYYPEREVENHDVLILGWDDSYPAYMFAVDPGEDGAYICLNTWGSEFGNDGIFYVSYADPNIANIGISYAGIEDTDNYDRIYQYDECGWVGQQGYDSGSCWFANVYTAKEKEMCAAAGFYATGADTSYVLYFIEDFEGTDSFENMQYLQEGSFADAGYYTVALEDPKELSAGERFAVVVQIDTPGVSNPVAVEYRADEYTQDVTTEGKESYISQYGTHWENTQERFETNVCLKVYTREK